MSQNPPPPTRTQALVNSYETSTPLPASPHVPITPPTATSYLPTRCMSFNLAAPRTGFSNVLITGRSRLEIQSTTLLERKGSLWLGLILAVQRRTLAYADRPLYLALSPRR